MTDLLQIVIALAPPPAVVAVASYLVSVGTPERGCFPKQRTIANRVGLALRSVNKAVAWLKTKGLVNVEQRGRTSALYSTVVEKPVENTQLALDFGGECVAKCVAIPISLSELPRTLGNVKLSSSVAESSARPAPAPEKSEPPQPRIEAQEATDRLGKILAGFPTRFKLTREAIAALAARLIRKAAYWKRPVADVEAYLERKSHAIGQQPWLRPWSPAWFTTDLEARFHLDDVDARAKPPPTASPPPKPIEYKRDDGVVAHFASAIADLARSKCMPTGRIV